MCIAVISCVAVQSIGVLWETWFTMYFGGADKFLSICGAACMGVYLTPCLCFWPPGLAYGL